MNATKPNDEYNSLAWSEAMEQSEGETVPAPNPVKWQYYDRKIRLAGTYQDKEWFYLIDVPVFVEGIYRLLTNLPQPTTESTRTKNGTGS